jgi:hypothetical protein
MIPELQPTSSVIRISPEIDVPITPRVRRLIDTAPFRRLAGVTQLGLVSLVAERRVRAWQGHGL